MPRVSPCADELVEQLGVAAGPAAEVDGPATGRRRQQVEQVAHRTLPLGPELLVAVRVPPVRSTAA